MGDLSAAHGGAGARRARERERLMAMGVGRVYPVSLDPAEPNDLNDTTKRVAA